MHYDYILSRKLEIAALFDGQLATMGIVEIPPKPDRRNARCLSDGKSMLTILADDYGHVYLMTSSSTFDARYIVNAIERLHGIRAYDETEHEFWNDPRWEYDPLPIAPDELWLNNSSVQSAVPNEAQFEIVMGIGEHPHTDVSNVAVAMTGQS